MQERILDGNDGESRGGGWFVAMAEMGPQREYFLLIQNVPMCALFLVRL